MIESMQAETSRMDIERKALEHVWVHSARWLDLAERDGLRVIIRGQGCRLIDAHGRTYLDGLSGLFVVNVGHRRTEIGDAASPRRGTRTISVRSCTVSVLSHPRITFGTTSG